MKKTKTSPSKALARLRGNLKRQRMEKTEVEQQSVGKVAMVGTAFAAGYAESKVPSEIAGIPTKLIAAGLSYVAALLTKGHLSKAAEGIGDSLGSIYAYKQGVQRSSGQLVAGNAVEWIVEK